MVTVKDQSGNASDSGSSSACRDSVAASAAASAEATIALSIVIVNFRTPDMTLDCVRSLEPEATSLASGCHVVVVENGSGDDSVQKLREGIERHGWSDWVKLVVSAENTGFAGGNNLGLAAIMPSRYVLLLNSDTISRPGVLGHCLQVMDSEPDIGCLT